MLTIIHCSHLGRSRFAKLWARFTHNSYSFSLRNGWNLTDKHFESSEVCLLWSDVKPTSSVVDTEGSDRSPFLCIQGETPSTSPAWGTVAGCKRMALKWAASNTACRICLDSASSLQHEEPFQSMTMHLIENHQLLNDPAWFKFGLLAIVQSVV
jgi:hypothetical protein